MICHVDSEGHTYDFGYGLNWSGMLRLSAFVYASLSKII